MTILWLTDQKGYKPETKSFLLKSLATGGVGGGSIFFNSLYYKVPSLADCRKKSVPDKYDQALAFKSLRDMINGLKPSLIVVNDEVSVKIITSKPYALGTVRGSVYSFDGIPCIVLDRVSRLYQSNAGEFIFKLDLEKVARYATGQVKTQPAFNFHRVRTIEEVLAFCAEASKATLCAVDTETAGGFITCISYTYDDEFGRLRTFCVPFFDPFCEGGTFWPAHEAELRVRLALKKLHASPVLKVLQNGTYDCAYCIIERMPLINYLVDTENLMHSIWVEAPKALHELASYFCDVYTYWKDDAKGIRQDGWGKDHSDLDVYWRYNGLDTYYTWLVASALVGRIIGIPWALRNYNTEFSLSVGPTLAASMRGIRLDQNRHAQIMAKELAKFEAGKRDIQALTDEPHFNINAPNDVAWMIYDVFGAKKTRLQRKGSKYGDRSTDEKVLDLIKEQGNVLTNSFIDRLLRAKKPGTCLSNFGSLNRLCWTDRRFHSKHSAAGTTTGRFNSGKWQLWTGRNGQNWEPRLRELLVADPGYVFFEIDYTASDDVFIAFESEDPAKMEQVKSDKNTHCYHASVFFSKPYDAIFAGYKNNEAWVVDSTKGVRQITKRITHGRNFRMGAGTLYNNMGRDAVVATALALGHEKAARYTDKELIAICGDLIDAYDHPRKGLYKRIRPWQDEIAALAKKNHNLVTCAFGMTRKFLGNVSNDPKTQRELSAFYGQGGTAGNCNRALNTIFYSGIDDGIRCQFLLQGHDSILFQIRADSLHLCGRIKSIMEQEFQIHGRTLRIPTDPKVGLTWSKHMLDWEPEVTYGEICDFERKTFDKKYPAGPETTLAQLDAIFSEDALIEALENELSAKFGQVDSDSFLDEPELVY